MPYTSGLSDMDRSLGQKFAKALLLLDLLSRCSLTTDTAQYSPLLDGSIVEGQGRCCKYCSKQGS